MKNFITCAVGLTVIALNVSCKKSRDPAANASITDSPAVIYPDYATAKKGNYWIYGRFKVETNGQVTDLNQTDSCYIDKDTVVRNKTYFRMRKYDFVYQQNRSYYYRDSLHYLVNLNGSVIFSSEDFSTVFYNSYAIENYPDSIIKQDTLSRISIKMTDQDLSVKVPAGTFKTLNMQTTYFYYPNHVYMNTENPRRLNYRYAKNVGLVMETEQFFLSTPYYTERRLIRYHLN